MDDQQRAAKLAEIRRLAQMDNVWVRLVKIPSLGNLMGIYSTLPEWGLYGHSTESLGLVPLASLKQGSEIPVVQGIGLDVGAGRDVRFLRLAPGSLEEDPEVVVAGNFGDRHPDEWVNQLFTDGRGVLAIGEKSPERFATMGDWMDTWHIGIVHTTGYYTADGVSARRPEPTRFS